MAASSWKSLALPGTILLIALGLQAGAIKIMTGSGTAHEPAPADAYTPSAPTHAEPPPAPVTHGAPSPEAGLATAHTPEPPAPPVAAHGAPSPEAGLAHTPSPAAPPAAQGAPSPEATLPARSAASPEAAYNPMASNIPPPIQLDAPEPPVETPATEAPPPSAEAELAMATPAAEPAAATPTATGALLEPDWLKGRDPKRYTVQLYSGKEMTKLQEIAESVNSASPAAYFTTASRSGPWYSLVVGDYADFPTAQAAATQIAGQSSSLKPWIRRFSEIQARMR